jgi:hypothetical protein
MEKEKAGEEGAAEESEAEEKPAEAEEKPAEAEEKPVEADTQEEQQPEVCLHSIFKLTALSTLTHETFCTWNMRFVVTLNPKHLSCGSALFRPAP